MYDQNLVDTYLNLLDAPPPTGRQKEQVVQDFLEAHTDLIPLPNLLNHGLNFHSIISKLPLGNELITDYVYLTKSSDTWRITLVELESPDKDLYTKDTKRPVKTAVFNAALDQVRQWKQFLATRHTVVEQTLRPLIQPPQMRDNPIEYDFQLIIGRSSNKNLTEDRKRDFRALQQETGITVMTFDQLADWYRQGSSMKKNVLRFTTGRYEFKSIAAGPRNILGHLGPGELNLSPALVANLTAQGHDMISWQAGELLIANGKQTLTNFSKTLHLPTSKVAP